MSEIKEFKADTSESSKETVLLTLTYTDKEGHHNSFCVRSQKVRYPEDLVDTILELKHKDSKTLEHIADCIMFGKGESIDCNERLNKMDLSKHSYWRRDN